MARSFTAAAKGFFGYKPGQTLREFGDELKDLTYGDKMEIAEGLRNIGHDCDDPIKAD